MQGPLQLLLCVVLLARGSCLVCEICQNNSISCNGTMKNCTTGKDTCVIVLTKNTLEGKNDYRIEKNCERSETCNNSYTYFDLGSGKAYQSQLYCCKEDTCSKVVAQLPALEEDPKAKQCPACHTLKKTCEKKTVGCSGPDSDCFSMTITTSLNGKTSKEIMKGCTSKSMCSILRSGKVPFLSNNTVPTKISCSGASQLLGSLLMTISGLLVLKFLVYVK